LTIEMVKVVDRETKERRTFEQGAIL